MNELAKKQIPANRAMMNACGCLEVITHSLSTRHAWRTDWALGRVVRLFRDSSHLQGLRTRQLLKINNNKIRIKAAQVFFVFLFVQMRLNLSQNMRQF